MTVGGSKGSISGNYAMENADLLVAVGTRFVGQSDCSRTGYPKVRRVININTDPDAATHYGQTIALVGDAGPTLRRLIETLKQCGAGAPDSPSPWMAECTKQRQAWEAFKTKRYNTPTLFDADFGEVVLTQPAAIKVAADWAKTNNVVSFFDAGDVQANGFQIVEDDRLGRTFTDTGASYLGWCEVHPNTKKCIYVRAYPRLKHYGEEDQLVDHQVPPVDYDLWQSSSWLNFYMGRDHTAKRLGIEPPKPKQPKKQKE